MNLAIVRKGYMGMGTTGCIGLRCVDCAAEMGDCHRAITQ